MRILTIRLAGDFGPVVSLDITKSTISFNPQIQRANLQYILYKGVYITVYDITYLFC
jgi:hypothetical protein